MKNELIITSPEELDRRIENVVRKVVSGFNQIGNNDEKEVYTNKQAMKFLGVSRSTLQRWREDGLLNFRKVNGTIMYTRSDLTELLENNKG